MCLNNMKKAQVDKELHKTNFAQCLSWWTIIL